MLLGDEALVAGVMENVETSALDEQHKALFRFVDRVNRDSCRLAAQDLDRLRAAGWTDEAIYYAVTVCALFNFYNRWIDACGVHPMSEKGHQQAARRMAARGYAPRT